MYHYTYLLQSQADDMMYIGVRSCQGTPEADNYWGSSKHLPKNVSEVCDKFILDTFDSRVEAVTDEIRRHNINDVVVSDIFWNKAKQTSTGFDTSGTTAWNKGLKSSDVTRAKISETHTKNPSYGFKGKLHSSETKEKISSAKQGKPTWMKGKSHSDEAKEKLREASRGKHYSVATEFKKDGVSWNKGVSPTNETKNKIRESMIAYHKERRELKEAQIVKN